MLSSSRSSQPTGFLYHHRLVKPTGSPITYYSAQRKLVELFPVLSRLYRALNIEINIQFLDWDKTAPRLLYVFSWWIH
jgi:hypothetical protein